MDHCDAFAEPATAAQPAATTATTGATGATTTAAAKPAATAATTQPTARPRASDVQQRPGGVCLCGAYVRERLQLQRLELDGGVPVRLDVRLLAGQQQPRVDRQWADHRTGHQRLGLDHHQHVLGEHAARRDSREQLRLEQLPQPAACRLGIQCG